MSDVLEYPDALQEVRGAMNPGRLKLQSNLVIFKNIKTGRVEQFPSSEVVKAQWLCRARGYCLKLRLENGSIHRFDGFKESDFEKLAPFLSKYYQKDLEKVDLSVRGWNYGVADFVGNSLHFSVHDKLAFEIPLSNVSHATTSKNEVTLEFHQNDDAPVSLMEVRFHIPSSSDNPDKDPVTEFHQNVLEKADIIQATGTAIATVEEIQCLTPRGRYDIKIYPTFLQLHGKTFDYKIPYNTVLRLFLLPHKDGRQMFFAVSLDPPIRQGQTRYPFLILLFNKDEETSLELGLSEEDIQEKYEGKLTKEMSGPMYEIVSRIMKACVNRKITVPGSFIGHSGTHAVGCSYKAATGFLYPLERGFMFVHKPPIHVRFDEVANVNFARSAANTRSFDFEVETKSGTIHTFVNIEKDEYGKLYDFVTSKGLGVKNIGSKKMTDDKYDELLDSEDEDEHDVYLERMKQEGKERAEDDDQDDDEDEDDDDYVAPESGSEVAEEFDTDFTSSSSEDEEGDGDDDKKKEKKEKKKKEKKEMKTKTVREGPRKKRKKEKKDPNAPKRPQSAYFLWLNEHREQIKRENPGISITEVSKKAGEMWKEVTDKTEWEQKAAAAKAEYEKAMEAYKAAKADADEEDEDSESPKAKKSKSPKKSSSSTKSPKKESKAGAGGEYKSKEFISSSEDSSTDSDDKPLKKKTKTEKEKKPKKEKEKKEKKPKKKEESESENEELPDDEEILSTPPSSGAGSGSGSGSDDDEDDD
ncbi:FACT complex subunit SSRP1 [Lingula anatina]|uniref:FACT complex subunit SSRP1 n=1 Tax=Lingula anatina TaxID=7574 RepID=A0A1S3I7A9_LINAN|nr:FACT complex subunit SSRP1 [Lingula anatina]|eukprot:XP_013394165.1 FACT complex subunit SSRP1 [Lingula anatina]